jgi:hypothetical protein
MPQLSLTASVLAAGLALATAMPAWAGYGAIAFDQQNGHEGAAWNQPTAAQANEMALKACATGACRVHPVAPAGCGALARNTAGKGWGGADRQTLSDAEHTAMLLCQKHTGNRACKVVAQGCNK